MVHWRKSPIFLMLMIPVMICPTVGSMENPGKPTSAESDDRLMNRIDFGNSYIRGQTIQSGAVYLLQRKKSDIESLLKVRRSYREEILKDFHVHETRTPPTRTEGLETRQVKP